jgi:hypothetical protein
MPRYDAEQMLNMEMGSYPDSAISEQERPTLFRVLFASCLLISFLSAFCQMWSHKFDNVPEKPLQQGKPDAEIEWLWKPFAMEKRLYTHNGYSTGWLDSPIMEKIREKLGSFSPSFELFALRTYGVFSNIFEFLVILLFAIFAGRVHYYDKVAAFEPISSTLYFRSVRFMTFGVVLTWLWIVFPFGVTIPFIGEAPILADMTGMSLGVVWASSPGVGFWLAGAVIWLGAFIAASNLRRLT